MPYLTCPRCGLTIRPRASSPLLDSCPRCLGRTGITVPMYSTERRAWSRPDREPINSTTAISAGAADQTQASPDPKAGSAA